MDDTLKDIFIYQGGKGLPKGSIRLSGSGFDKWVTKPWNWNYEEVLKLERFEGNTSSVLGTAVHKTAECFHKGISGIKDEVISQMHEFSAANPDLELDTEEISNQFPGMSMELVNAYLRSSPKASAVEEDLSIHLTDNYYVEGQVDRVEEDVVIDFKTYNSATEPKGIKLEHKRQLLFYVWLYKQLGKTMDRIRVVYISRAIDTRRISEKTGKPIGKITPPKVTVHTEVVDQKDLDWTNSMIMLWVKTMKFSEQHPDFHDVIFHDPRLTK